MFIRKDECMSVEQAGADADRSRPGDDEVNKVSA